MSSSHQDLNHVETADKELERKIREWLQWDRNPATLSEIQHLVDAKNFDVLGKLLLKRLAFGTAGLRGKMGAGFNAMNDLVIVQTGQGLVKYLEETAMEKLKTKGIVIGYDGRHNSRRFAELTAAVFLSRKYPVQLFSTVVPTPFVPFAVTKYNAIMGVMITASHNPKEDNGYKVYGENGAQIISPVDKRIQEQILQNLVPLESSWDLTALFSKFKNDPLEEVTEAYMDVIRGDLFPDHVDINMKTKLMFTYTPMHGVGQEYFSKAMGHARLKMIPVPQQMHTNPEFPTVKFPNPEEGKSALDLAIQTADANNSTIIIANDPDADRMAAAEKNLKTGQWRIFNGNEIGALLGWWALHCFHVKFAHEKLSNVYMMSSTVSSKILRTMAAAEGFQFIETLTGFKWMGNKAHALVKSGKHVLFAFEEAIGFMWGTAVLDKDGISAGIHLATLASYLKHHDLTLAEQLQEIYDEYGYHLSLNSYYICHDPAVITRIFQRIRNFKDNTVYPTDILNGKYTIETVRDLTTGYDNSQSNNQAILPVSKDSQMITFEFHNGLVATLRTSGTEPKIKYYTELCAKPKQGNREELETVLHEMVEALVQEMLQPDVNGLQAKSD